MCPTTTSGSRTDLPARSVATLAVVTPPSAEELDATDPLRTFRDRFAFPDPDLVYLDGNSMGRMPMAAPDRAAEMLHSEWADRLIRSWNDGWWELPLRLGDSVATVVGAAPGEVAIADSTSVNLFKLATTALDRLPDRPVVLTDDLNFTSDWYVLDAAARRADGDHRVEVVASPRRRARAGGRHRRPARRRRGVGQPVAGHLRQRIPLRPGGDHGGRPRRPGPWCSGT